MFSVGLQVSSNKLMSYGPVRVDKLRVLFIDGTVDETILYCIQTDRPPVQSVVGEFDLLLLKYGNEIRPSGKGGTVEASLADFQQRTYYRLRHAFGGAAWQNDVQPTKSRVLVYAAAKLGIACRRQRSGQVCWCFAGRVQLVDSVR